VEVVFGSGAGTYVKAALGRRSSIAIEGDGEIEGNAVQYNHVPKLVARRLSTSSDDKANPPEYLA